MTDTQGIPGDLDLAYAQAVKYGKDLARIYGQEKAKRQELQIANQKLNAILQTAPNGLAVLDQEMRIVETNPRFEALLEQRGQCVGRSIADLVPDEDRLLAALDNAAENSHLEGIEISIAQPTKRTLQVSGARLSAGKQEGWVVSLNDLTESKRLAGLKEEFIDIAAHELRTPLAIILGFASVLEEDTDETADPAMAAPIDAIVRAANRLKMVINELVEFASARNRSDTESQLDEFDLREVIDVAVGSQAYQAEQQGIRVKVSHPVQVLTLRGDRVIIAQSIEHVLENAIRFNQPDGWVELRSRAEGDEVVLEIEDTGGGIPSTDLDRIFDMFYQVEEHMTRAQGGLGLGLSIAKRGIELHGGRMQARSTLGEGSCFSIFLPTDCEQVFISPTDRLDSAHKQTLRYGRDVARAFVAQRSLASRLRNITQMTDEMLDCLSPQAAQAESDRIRALCRDIIQESKGKRSRTGEGDEQGERSPD